MVNSATKLYIVIPCFNETAVLKETVTHLLGVIDGMVKENLVRRDSAILCVDDGSSDGTWALIGEYIGKIYLETKARPRYFIAEKLEND